MSTSSYSTSIVPVGVAISANATSVPLTTTISNTILTGTQTALPTARLPQGCGTGITNPDTRNPACAIPATNFSSSILHSCCNNAPRILYSNNCNIYCEAKNQTLEELNDCIKDQWNVLNATGLFIICNRAGESFSSTLPAETQTQLGTGTSTSTSTSTQTGGAVSWRRGGDGVLSLGGWAAAVMLVGSMMLGTMI